MENNNKKSTDSYEYSDNYKDDGPRTTLRAYVEGDGSEEEKSVISLKIDVPEVFESHFSFSISNAEIFIRDMQKLINDAKWKEASRCADPAMEDYLN